MENYGWAVYIGDERYAWVEQEWIAEDMVKDLQNISEYEKRNVYYIWEKKGSTELGVFNGGMVMNAKWVCVNPDSTNFGEIFSSPKEALEGLGWWQNKDGTWNEHGDCDDEGYSESAALTLCQVVVDGN